MQSAPIPAILGEVSWRADCTRCGSASTYKTRIPLEWLKVYCVHCGAPCRLWQPQGESVSLGAASA